MLLLLIAELPLLSKETRLRQKQMDKSTVGNEKTSL